MNHLKQIYDTLPPRIMEVENGPLGDKPVIFQAPNVHFDDYGRKVSRFSPHRTMDVLLGGDDGEMSQNKVFFCQKILNDVRSLGTTLSSLSPPPILSSTHVNMFDIICVFFISPGFLETF